MTRKIIKIMTPKISKIKPKAQFAVLYLSMITGSTVICSVVQPDYRPEYTFRRNLYDGFCLGLFAGIIWPISIPFMIDYSIRNSIEYNKQDCKKPVRKTSDTNRSENDK